MKGISPLIASVVLIAVTLAIAGILTTWSVQFVGQKGSNILKQADCLGALEVDQDYIRFNAQSQNLAFIMRNTKNNIELTGLQAILIYPDADVKQYFLSQCCSLQEPIPALGVASVSIPTNKTIKPDKIDILAANCPEYKVSVRVPVS